MPLKTLPFDQQPLLTALRQFVPTNDPRAIVLQTAAPDMRAKLPVYTLGLQDIVNDGGTQAVATAGWRYIASANGVTAAADLTQTSGGSLKVSSLSSGSQISKAMDTLRTLSRRDELRTQLYDVALLRIPGVRVEGYWLRSRNALSGTDQWIPYLAFNPQLQAQPIWTTDAFLASIKTVAQNDLRFFQSDIGYSSGT